MQLAQQRRLRGLRGLARWIACCARGWSGGRTGPCRRGRRDRRAISRNPASSGPTRLWSSKIPGSRPATSEAGTRLESKMRLSRGPAVRMALIRGCGRTRACACRSRTAQRAAGVGTGPDDEMRQSATQRHEALLSTSLSRHFVRSTASVTRESTNRTPTTDRSRYARVRRS